MWNLLAGNKKEEAQRYTYLGEGSVGGSGFGVTSVPVRSPLSGCLYERANPCITGFSPSVFLPIFFTIPLSTEVHAPGRSLSISLLFSLSPPSFSWVQGRLSWFEWREGGSGYWGQGMWRSVLTGQIQYKHPQNDYYYESWNHSCTATLPHRTSQTWQFQSCYLIIAFHRKKRMLYQQRWSGSAEMTVFCNIICENWNVNILQKPVSLKS